MLKTVKKHILTATLLVLYAGEFGHIMPGHTVQTLPAKTG